MVMTWPLVTESILTMPPSGSRSTGGDREASCARRDGRAQIYGRVVAAAPLAHNGALTARPSEPAWGRAARA